MKCYPASGIDSFRRCIGSNDWFADFCVHPSVDELVTKEFYKNKINICVKMTPESDAAVNMLSGKPRRNSNLMFEDDGTMHVILFWSWIDEQS